MNVLSLIDADKLGGWVRAAVASGLVALVHAVPMLTDIISPDTQTALAAIAATIVVGAWSHVAKSLAE
jgi:hypothetical protein